MYLLLICQSGEHAAGLPVRNNPPRIFIRGKETHNPARDHVANVGENATRFIHLLTKRLKPCGDACANNTTPVVEIPTKKWRACVCRYHARRVSVLKSEIQLLTRWAAAQDDGKNVLRGNDVACRQLSGKMTVRKCRRQGTICHSCVYNQTRENILNTQILSVVTLQLRVFLTDSKTSVYSLIAA